MIKSVINYSIFFVVLLVVQVAFLNHISLWGYATPLLYIYFIIKLPTLMNRNWLITLGFVMGLLVDLFCNTPGMHAIALTTAAMFRYYILSMFITHEESAITIPSINSMGVGNFLRYAFVVVAIHQIVLFTVDAFSLFNAGQMLLRIVSSTLLTVLIIMAIESMRRDEV